MNKQDWETECQKREDKTHCTCWYDGETCCACGDNSVEAKDNRAHPVFGANE
jgi:hypothetical protein